RIKCQLRMRMRIIFAYSQGFKNPNPGETAPARDYIAIPASEVAVERPFNSGRDMLGLRRYSLSGTL
ncbi:hypothetical protein V1507DRAFT_465578, partial [Lipomyces tetrasporus]